MTKHFLEFFKKENLRHIEMLLKFYVKVKALTNSLEQNSYYHKYRKLIDLIFNTDNINNIDEIRTNIDEIISQLMKIRKEDLLELLLEDIPCTDTNKEIIHRLPSLLFYSIYKKYMYTKDPFILIKLSEIINLLAYTIKKDPTSQEQSISQEQLKSLFQYPDNPNEVKEKHNFITELVKTILHKEMYSSVKNFLLAVNNPDIFSKIDDHNRNIIHYLISFCPYDFQKILIDEILKPLIEANSKLIEDTDKDGNNILHYAISKGVEAQIISQHIIDNYPNLLHQCNTNNVSPLTMIYENLIFYFLQISCFDKLNISFSLRNYEIKQAVKLYRLSCFLQNNSNNNLISDYDSNNNLAFIHSITEYIEMFKTLKIEISTILEENISSNKDLQSNCQNTIDQCDLICRELENIVFLSYCQNIIDQCDSILRKLKNNIDDKIINNEINELNQEIKNFLDKTKTRFKILLKILEKYQTEIKDRKKTYHTELQELLEKVLNAASEDEINKITNIYVSNYNTINKIAEKIKSECLLQITPKIKSECLPLLIKPIHKNIDCNPVIKLKNFKEIIKEELNELTNCTETFIKLHKNLKCYAHPSITKKNNILKLKKIHNNKIYFLQVDKVMYSSISTILMLYFPILSVFKQSTFIGLKKEPIRDVIFFFLSILGALLISNIICGLIELDINDLKNKNAKLDKVMNSNLKTNLNNTSVNIPSQQNSISVNK